MDDLRPKVEVRITKPSAPRHSLGTIFYEAKSSSQQRPDKTADLFWSTEPAMHSSCPKGSYKSDPSRTWIKSGLQLMAVPFITLGVTHIGSILLLCAKPDLIRSDFRGLGAILVCAFAFMFIGLQIQKSRLGKS